MSTPCVALTDREWLRERYVADMRSAAEVAEEAGCNPATVRRALHRHGIPTRPAVVRPKVSLGGRYGLLVVAEFAGVKDGARTYVARCDCGNETVVRAGDLSKGNTKSCGCLKRPHGHSTGHRPCGPSRAYACWQSMHQRCDNPNSSSYKDYGGRGITVCTRWRESFENFLADMGEPPEGLSIDRIDNDGDYEPSNCRWATAKEQRANQRPKATAL